MMKRTSRRLMIKCVLAACASAVISTCFVSTTFAALSASFTWTSDPVNSGAFDLTDQNYKLSLFGKGEIYPGDFGSEELRGADFGAKTVTWSFRESNSGGIPVIYYVSAAEDSEHGYFSSYDFSNQIGADDYIKLPDGEFIPCGRISTDAVELASKLKEGVKLNWIWPDKLYLKNGAEYSADTGEKATAYEERNARLCRTDYVFDEAMLRDIYDKVLRVATAKIESGFSIITKPAFEFTDGALKEIPTERNGVFEIYDSVEKGDAYVFFVQREAALTLTAAYQNVESGGEYTEDVANNEMHPVTVEPVRALIKVYPAASGERASVSVTVEATVYAG